MPAGSDRGISSRYLAFATTFLDPFDFAQGWLSLGMTAICGMRNLATWMRRSDEKYFAPFLLRYSEVKVWNAAKRKVPFEKMHGLLLTGGPDVAPEFLNQPQKWKPVLRPIALQILRAHDLVAKPPTL
jgi:hypothetical protein